jgi:hypothetical protein
VPIRAGGQGAEATLREQREFFLGDIVSAFYLGAHPRCSSSTLRLRFWPPALAGVVKRLLAPIDEQPDRRRFVRLAIGRTHILANSTMGLAMRQRPTIVHGTGVSSGSQLTY